MVMLILQKLRQFSNKEMSLEKKIKFFEIDHEILEIDYKSQLKIAEFKTKLRKKDGKIYPS